MGTKPKKPQKNKALEALRRYYQQGVDAQKKGDLSLAKQHFEQMLALDTHQPDALHALAIIELQSDNLSQALVLAQKAITAQPNMPLFFNTLGIIYKRQGEFSNAHNALQNGLSLEPDNIDLLVNIGNVLQSLGQFDLAKKQYQKVIELNPTIAEAHNNLGNIYVLEKDYPQAELCFKAVLNTEPHFFSARLSLSELYRILGRFNEATMLAQQALQDQPQAMNAYKTLALCQADEQNAQLALETCITALNIDANHVGIQQTLSFILKRLHYQDYQVWLEPILTHCFSMTGFDHQTIAYITAQQFLAKHQQESLPKTAMQTSAFFADPLLLGLLTKVLNVHPSLEQLLTDIRQTCLAEYLRNQLSKADENILIFLSALASQCYYNEYIFNVTEQEQIQLAELQGQFSKETDLHSAVAQKGLLLLACYQELSSIPRLYSIQKEPLFQVVQPLIETQINQPALEKQLQSTIPQQRFKNTVSEKVQQHYETNPYPRWYTLANQAPCTLAEYFANHFPNRMLPDAIQQQPKILVAGCGTGAHPLRLAKHFPGAEILAIDLSLTSLAYAKRRAEQAGIKNVRFEQSDILALESFTQQFHLVESIGVLHHLADPWLGLEKLMQCLVPNGVALVGLYSKLARTPIVGPAQKLIEHMRLSDKAEDIKSLRQKILASEDSRFAPILHTRDFYSLSECRDLLFHQQEIMMDLDDIKQGITQLDLSFLGFQQANVLVRQEYSKAFPEDKLQINLDNWKVFEETHPDTFKSLYRFWVG